MTNANVKKEKKERKTHTKTNHTLKLPVTKKCKKASWNKRVITKTILTYMRRT